MVGIKTEEIHEALSRYRQPTIATLLSHSAAQIIYGARVEKFRTIGIATPGSDLQYQNAPNIKPDRTIYVKSPEELLNDEIQEELLKENAIVIPHGSFVAYIGADAIRENFRVPMFGNRATLYWEADRKKQREWLTGAGLKMPEELSKNQVSKKKPGFVKFGGARGGRGFFVAYSREQVDRELKRLAAAGEITKGDVGAATIQEFIPGLRYYPHLFLSPLEKGDVAGYSAEGGGARLELLGIDKRRETIDESYRAPEVKAFQDYTVSGNEPVILREKLNNDILRMGKAIAEKAVELMPPGVPGTFNPELIYHPKSGFVCFEISARIVAGSNLYMGTGSYYSYMYYDEPMWMGRRIALEISDAARSGELPRIIA